MSISLSLQDVIGDFSEKLPQFIGSNDIAALYSKISLISERLIVDSVLAGPITKTGDVLTTTEIGDKLSLGAPTIPINSLTAKTYSYISATTYSGSGLDDFSPSGLSTEASLAVYEIKIDGLNIGGTDTFTYRKNGGAWNPGNNCSDGLVFDGITFTFSGGGLGHQLDDFWTFKDKGLQPFSVLDITDAPILSVIDASLIGGNAVQCFGVLQVNDIELLGLATELTINSVKFLSDVSGTIIYNAQKIKGQAIWPLSGPIVDVKAFGAAGDGITNDTNALNRAFNAAQAIAYDTEAVIIYFPEGSYKITSPIIRNLANVAYKIVGAGSNRTKIITTNLASAHAMLEFQAGVYGLSISGLTIQGSYQAPSTGTGIGIINTSASVPVNVSLKDVVIKGGLGQPVYLKGDLNFSADACYFTGNIVDAGTSCIFTWPQTKTIRLQLNNCDFIGSPSGIQARQDTLVNAIQCRFINCTSGIYTEDMTAAIDPQVKLDQCRFSGCTNDLNLVAPLSRAILNSYLTDGVGLAKLAQPSLVAIADAKSLITKKIAITKTYSNFVPTPDALSNDIEIFSLPAGAVIKDVYANVLTKFIGGAIATYTISVGIGGSVIKYMVANDVFTNPIILTAAVNKGAALTTVGQTNLESFSASTSIRAYATSTVGKLGEAAQGVIIFYITYEDYLV